MSREDAKGRDVPYPLKGAALPFVIGPIRLIRPMPGLSEPRMTRMGSEQHRPGCGNRCGGY